MFKQKCTDAEPTHDCEEVWFGLNDRAEEGVYRWADNSQSDYTNYKANEPNDWGDDGEDCTSFNKESEWNDSHCSKEFAFMCQN
jgi:hypothetical protein